MDGLIRDMTIGRILEETANRFPSYPACVDISHRYSYQEFNSITDDIACGFLKAGIHKNTHVGLLTNDSTRSLSLYFALWKIGAVVIPLCTAYQISELEFCIETADIQWMIIEKGMKTNEFESLCSQLKQTFQIISVADDDHVIALIESGQTINKKILQEIKEEVYPSDTDCILFTSGTSGKMKPVETTHYSRVNTMIYQAKTLHVTENDRYCSALPMYHCFSLTGTVLAAATAGACVCFPENRHSSSILDTVEKEKCTVLTAVPALFDAVMRRQKSDHRDISSLQKGMIGGSTYTEEFYKELCETLSYRILPSLGQTEATAGICIADYDAPQELLRKSIGKAFPHTEVCIKDTVWHQKLDAMKCGELCVRGYNVMKGYYHDQRATQRVIDPEGWLHTGDLAFIDAEGNIFYQGRIKDIIIRGGENISPTELEDILRKNPKVEGVRIIGVPDAHYIEEICACVVKKENITEEEIRNYLKGKVADFKIPKYIMFIKDFPRTATGKIQTAELRKIAVEKFGIKEIK